jgi:hypothetical protein
MTDREYNKIRRNFTLIHFFNDHLATLNVDAPILSNYIVQLNTAMQNIQTHGSSLIENITGYTIQINVFRTLMEKQALKVSGSMRAYFIANDDELNAELASVSKSFLRNSRQEISLVKCENILKMANEHSAVIVPFGVSATMLSDLETHINNYKNILTDTKFARREKVSSRRKLTEAIAECDKVVKIISGIMEALAESHDFLYLQFKRNLRIGKSGGGKGKKPDFEEEISPGEVALIADMPYDKKRSFKMRNQSKASLKWGLSQSETEFTSPAHILKPNTTSQKLSSTLAPNGNFLLIENLSETSAKIQIWTEGGEDG